MIRRLWATAFGYLILAVRNGLLYAYLQACPRISHRGFVIADCSGSDESDALFQKARRAIDLIHDLDRRRFGRIRRDVRRIVFLGTGPQYWPGLRACIFHDVTRTRTEFVALTIVHEATHARLWNAGFRYHPSIRKRIERLCVAQELVFLERLPDDDEELLNFTKTKLDRPWWTREERIRRTKEDLERVLNSDGSAQRE